VGSAREGELEKTRLGWCRWEEDGCIDSEMRDGGRDGNGEARCCLPARARSRRHSTPMRRGALCLIHMHARTHEHSLSLQTRAPCHATKGRSTHYQAKLAVAHSQSPRSEQACRFPSPYHRRGSYRLPSAVDCLLHSHHSHTSTAAYLLACRLLSAIRHAFRSLVLFTPVAPPPASSRRCPPLLCLPTRPPSAYQSPKPCPP
jgi:hypothetical protein